MRVAPRYLDAGIPRANSSWKKVEPGLTWLPEAEATWFLTTAVVPDGWSGGPLLARLEIGGEAMTFVNGKPHQSLNTVRGDNLPRSELILAEEARPGDRFDIAVEAARTWHPLKVTPQTFALAELAVPHPPVRKLLHWLRIALEAAFALPESSTERLRLVRLLDQVVTGIDFQQAGTDLYLRSVSGAARNLERALSELGPSPAAGNFTLIGHAHIDTAWLWPLAETERKCGRTFSNALRLMEQYPEFRFSQSQPQLYQFTKERFPDIYEDIKRRVAEGRWEPIGGAWVECDCNLPSGESLVRQFLYGKRFFRQEFGRDTDVGWWPDAFGYSWSLPQILAHCGIEYFFTTKLTWNLFNTFPHKLFWWQGLDGTRLLAVNGQPNYNGQVRPRELTSLWQEFPERDRVDELPFSFGYGDGGGGPTAEMIEYGRRISSLPGMPQCQFGTARECFQRLSRQSESLPLWNDELYLELHRGCQTTQARTKRGNRKLELLLRDVEQFAALADVSVGADYPRERLVKIWERLLCLQFHDVLPGSSIRQVYEEAERDYDRLIGEAELLRAQHLGALAAAIDTRGAGRPVVVFNSLSWERTEVVEATVTLAGESFQAVAPSGEATPCQVLSRQGRKVSLLFLADGVPAFGYAVYRILPAREPSPARSGLRASRTRLENLDLRLRFDRSGRLVSVFDKRVQREALAPGSRGNLLQLFDDRPVEYEAWDIDPWFEEQMQEAPDPETIELVEAGPLRARLRQVRRTEHSTITQDIVLQACSPRVDFVTHVDWRERRMLLKCAFPVDILSPQATYEIQYGAITRATHNNTTWDRAKFEVPAHRWADLSEADYGVALLNDCKYGYDVKGNLLRLSLLRSPVDPDPEADQGEHEFTYALYPHAGAWQQAHVVRQGLQLNVPLLAVPTSAHAGPLPATYSALCADRPHVVVDTLKKAEDGDDLILRVYEAHGARGRLNLSIDLPLAKAFECNGLEEDLAPADWSDGALHFDMRPWQLRSFRLRRKRR